MSADRPNILLITTDQQRFDTITSHGNPYIDTPHLDWLSDEGISYRRASGGGAGDRRGRKPLCAAWAIGLRPRRPWSARGSFPATRGSAASARR